MKRMQSIPKGKLEALVIKTKPPEIIFKSPVKAVIKARPIRTSGF
jgi:hypothetical protein